MERARHCLPRALWRDLRFKRFLIHTQGISDRQQNLNYCNSNPRQTREEICQRIIKMCFSIDKSPFINENKDLTDFEKEYLTRFYKPSMTKEEKVLRAQKIISEIFGDTQLKKTLKSKRDEVLLATTAKQNNNEVLKQKLETFEEPKIVKGEVNMHLDCNERPLKFLDNRVKNIDVIDLSNVKASKAGNDSSDSSTDTLNIPQKMNEQVTNLADLGIIGNETKVEVTKKNQKETETEERNEGLNVERSSLSPLLKTYISTNEEVNDSSNSDELLPFRYYQKAYTIDVKRNTDICESCGTEKQRFRNDVQHVMKTMIIDSENTRKVDKGTIHCQITLTDRLETNPDAERGNSKLQHTEVSEKTGSRKREENLEAVQPITSFVTPSDTSKVELDGGAYLQTNRKTIIEPDVISNKTNREAKNRAITAMTQTSGNDSDPLDLNDKNICLNELLRRVRLRNKMEHYSRLHIICSAIATKAQRRKKNDPPDWPPPAPTAPQPEKAIPQKPQPIIPMPCTPKCPTPTCPNTYPATQDPCPQKKAEKKSDPPPKKSCSDEPCPSCPPKAKFQETRSLLKFIKNILVQSVTVKSELISDVTQLNGCLQDGTVNPSVSLNEINCLSSALMARGLEPWCPIPSWPAPRESKPCPKTLCDKKQCRLIPPPKSKSSCRDIDCKNNSYKWPPRR